MYMIYIYILPFNCCHETFIEKERSGWMNVLSIPIVGSIGS